MKVTLPSRSLTKSSTATTVPTAAATTTTTTTNMGNIVFNGEVEYNGALLQSNVAAEFGILGALLSNEVSNDFDFFVRICDSKKDNVIFSGSRDPDGDRPSGLSFFRDYSVTGRGAMVPYRACFDFRGLFPSLESMAFLEENSETGEWCHTQCFAVEDAESNIQANVPTIVLQESEPEPPIVSIQNRLLHLALTVEGGACRNGARIIVDTPSSGIATQQFVQHFDGSFESAACPGLYMDVAGRNCQQGEIILYQKNNQLNQQWGVTDITSTVQSFGTIYDIRSETCPSYGLSIPSDTGVVNGQPVTLDTFGFLGAGIFQEWQLHSV